MIGNIPYEVAGVDTLNSLNRTIPEAIRTAVQAEKTRRGIPRSDKLERGVFLSLVEGVYRQEATRLLALSDRALTRVKKKLPRSS